MRKFAFWLAFISVTAAGQAIALEIGGVKVRSHLNEPLVATVPVRVANIQERNSLAATLATDTEYVARGLQPLSNPDDYIVQVTEGGGLEQMLIELRSLSEINEPYLNLVLQLVWDGGNEVREFTILLDPAPVAQEPETIEPPMGLQPSEPARPAQAVDDPALQQLAAEFASQDGVSVSGPKPKVVIRKVHPDDYLAGKTSGGTSTIPAPRFTGDSYGPVAAGETLWGIATKVRPNSSVSMAQVMEALFQANPAAFDGSYNTLKKGAVLTVPSAETMAATQAGQTGTAATRPQTSEPAEAPMEDIEPAEDTPGIWMSQDERRSEKVDAQQLESKGGLITKSSAPPAVDAETDAAEQAPLAADGAKAAQKAAIPEADESATVSDPGRLDYAAEEPAFPEQTDADATAADSQLEAGSEEALAEATGEGTDIQEPIAPAEPVAEPSAETVSPDSANTLLLAGVILLVLLLTYWWYRRRRANEEAQATGGFAAPMAEEPVIDDMEVAEGDGGVAVEADEPEAVKTAAPGSDGDEVLSQADTYLSYGLYESAAEVLEKGIAAQPDRDDLRLKLLETHETAGNSDAFVAATQDWENSQGPLDDSTRDRIIAMGQRVAPGIALFGAAAAVMAEADEAESDTPVDETEEELPTPDFDLDESAEELGSFSESPPTEPVQETEADSVALDLDEDLEAALAEAPEPDEGDIEDLDLPGLDVEQPAEESDEAETPASLDLDLGELDLDEVDKSAEEPEAPVTETAEPPESFDFNLDDLSLDKTPEAEPETDTELEDLEEPTEDDLDLSISESDVKAEVEEAAPVPDEAEYDVKMDLAQAYLDMGEPDLARGLLDEVMDGGNDSQRQAAQKLLDDLG